MAEGSVAPSCLADRRWLHRELSPGRRRDHDHSCSKTPRAWDATGANRNHPKRALLIDDDNGVRNVIFDIVTSFGYVTDAAANGPEGLALFEKNLYDVVLTDLLMPGMTGWECSGRCAGWTRRSRWLS